jgi:hypothetical protein
MGLVKVKAKEWGGAGTRAVPFAVTGRRTHFALWIVASSFQSVANAEPVSKTTL